MHEESQNTDDPEMADVIESMKRILIKDESHVETIKDHLEKTRAYRRNLITRSTVDLLETFPYFFVRPQLVSSFLFFVSKEQGKMNGFSIVQRYRMNSRSNFQTLTAQHLSIIGLNSRQDLTIYLNPNIRRASSIQIGPRRLRTFLFF